MRLYVNIESLGFELGVGRIVDAGHSPRRRQVVQIAGQLSKFSPRALLLPLRLLLLDLLVVLVQLASNLVIFRLHVLQILLARIEIVLILARVESAVAK
mgnify:CR=1 FL=1